MSPKCYAVQCIVNEENFQNCPFSLGFCHPTGGGPSHGHRQHAQKFGKDRACGSGDMLPMMLADRQTHTQTCLLQYFATAPAGEVTNSMNQIFAPLVSVRLINVRFCFYMVTNRIRLRRSKDRTPQSINQQNHNNYNSNSYN